MFLRQLFIDHTCAVWPSSSPHLCVNATLPPEVRRELSELMKELKDVNSHVRKKEVDQAKEIIRKADDRIKELAIADDEKDRTYSTFKGQLEKARNLIPVSFEHEVAPILKDNCLRCHGESKGPRESADGHVQWNRQRRTQWSSRRTAIACAERNRAAYCIPRRSATNAQRRRETDGRGHHDRRAMD